MPDEVPPERIAVHRMLRLEILNAVLADHIDPALGKHAHLLEAHILRRGNNRYARPNVRLDALVARANLSRR